MPEERIERLERSVASDPGSAAFPALAEAYRREGRHVDAEHVLRDGLERKPDCLPASVVLCLVLLDQGRSDEARNELLRVARQVLAAEPASEADAPAGLGEVSEAELDDAFADAETDRDQVIDADRVAENALLEADLAAPEALAPTAASAFTTRTMADLLEKQGDTQAASRIRAALGEASVDAAPRRPKNRRQTIATLERWIENIRGGRA